MGVQQYGSLHHEKSFSRQVEEALAYPSGPLLDDALHWKLVLEDVELLSWLRENSRLEEQV